MDGPSVAVVKVSRAAFPTAGVSEDGNVAMSEGTGQITVTGASDVDESPSVIFPAGALIFVAVAAGVAFFLDRAGNPGRH